ncbi:MAG: TRAM domain-containing protein, partial [Bacilli bacterium]
MEAKVLKLTCEDLNHRGMGVCKADRFPIFVPGLLPGEVALVEVKDLRKTYGYGRVVSQLSLSKERTVPVCPSFGECGGCQI